MGNGKSETYAGNWNIFDARRPEFNETDGILRSNTSGANSMDHRKGLSLLALTCFQTGSNFDNRG